MIPVACNHDYVRKAIIILQGTANNSVVYFLEAGSL